MFESKTDVPEEDRRNKQIVIRASQNEIDHLHASARRMGLTKADFIRQAISYFAKMIDKT